MEIKNKIISLIGEATKSIREATVLIDEVKVSEKVGEDYVITPEFEQIVYEVNKFREVLEDLAGKNASTGALDRLEDTVKGKLQTFFKTQYKQKKYEGSLMEMGYRVVERKVVDGKADPRFIILKETPNSKAIEEYRKATKTDDNPDGKLPEGIQIKTYEYVTYKEVLNG
jgi:hypothetical protein